VYRCVAFEALIVISSENIIYSSWESLKVSGAGWTLRSAPTWPTT
jgi:hypothetical protein